MKLLDHNIPAWLELTNPLRWLSIANATAFFDQARRYGSPRLQYIYNEIEAVNPILSTCVERRASALSSMGWRFSARADADSVLADEQRDALCAFVSGIGNFTEAIEHLDQAFFRGYAHIQPLWEGEGVQRIALLDSWNFLYDRATRQWYWNPECRLTPSGCTSAAGARLVSVVRRKAIDYPALFIHIRMALGEADWGRFIERYGIPPVHTVMPPGVTDEQKRDFQTATDDAKDGLCTTWPSGTSLSFAESARGVNPFAPFIEHCQKEILILATGGTLATLAESGAGTLAGNAQQDIWRQIVSRDAAVISDALNKSLFRPFLQAAFPGRPVAASFELGEDENLSASDLFDIAAKARAAGYTIEKSELEEGTGYTLVPGGEEPATPPAAPPQGGFGPLANELHPQTALQTREKPLQNAAKQKDGQSPVQDETALKSQKNGGLESAIASIIAQTFAEELSKATPPPATNATDAQGNDHSEADGRFVSKGKGGDGIPEKPQPSEAAHYTAEHRSKVGQSGDWKSLDLPSLRDITPDEPRGEGKTKIADARKRIAKGESIKDPLGASHEINAKTTSHWTKKGKNIADVNERLALLDEAEDTISKPHEIWKGVKRKGTAFIRMVKTPDGKSVINVAEMKDGTVSWHGNEVSFDYWREGRLLYVR